MTVSTINGSTSDVSIRGGSNTSWAAARAVADGSSVRSDGALLAGYGSANAGDEFTYTIGRGFLFFDTSAIPSDAIINSVTLDLYVTSSVYDNGTSPTMQVCVVSHNAANTPPTTADFDLIGSTDLATRVNYLTWGANGTTPNAYKTLTLNSAGRAAINRGGTTKLALICSADLDNSAPASTKYAGANIISADGANPPKLTIDWTPGTVAKSASDSGTATEGTTTVVPTISTSASDSASVADGAAVARGVAVAQVLAATQYGLTSDGSVRGGSAASWAAARAASGSSVRTDGFLLAGYASNNAGDEFTYTIGRGFLNFDTSWLPAGAEITDVKLGLYVTNVYNAASGGGGGPNGSVVVTSGSPASSPPSTSDFGQVGTTDFGRLAYASMGAHASNPNTYKEITLNAAGRAAINAGGTTKLALLTSQDFDNSAPGSLQYNGAYIASADAAGTTTDPYLLITYTSPLVFGVGQDTAAATEGTVAVDTTAQAKSASDSAAATDAAATAVLLPRGISDYANAASAAITKGASGKWDDTIVYLPRWCKNLDGTLYRDSQNRAYLYYAGSGATAGVDRDRVGLMRTTDFSTWERVSTNSPVLGWGPSGTYDASGSVWDGTDVAATTILWDGSQFIMFFEGNSTANEAGDNIQIGVATSSDGVTWTKYAGNPILTVGANGTDAGGDVYAPIVMKDGSTWKMWYGGHSGSHQPSSYGGNYGVMYATAPAATGPWTKYSNSYVFKPTENIGPEQILKDVDGTYRLVYANYDDVSVVKVATSPDGITWAYEKSLLAVGGFGAWDAGGVYWTDTAIDNGRQILAYTGRNAGATVYGIGVVVSVPVGSDTAVAADSGVQRTTGWYAVDAVAMREAATQSSVGSTVSLSTSDVVAAADSAVTSVAPNPTGSDDAAATDTALALTATFLAFDVFTAEEGLYQLEVAIPTTSSFTLTACQPGTVVSLYLVGSWRGEIAPKRYAGQAPPIATETADDYGELTFAGLENGYYMAVADSPRRYRRMFMVREG